MSAVMLDCDRTIIQFLQDRLAAIDPADQSDFTHGRRVALLLALRLYVEKRRHYLKALLYHHECNITEPTEEEQAEYLEALTELQALSANEEEPIR